LQNVDELKVIYRSDSK